MKWEEEEEEEEEEEDLPFEALELWKEGEDGLDGREGAEGVGQGWAGVRAHQAVEGARMAHASSSPPGTVCLAARSLLGSWFKDSVQGTTASCTTPDNDRRWRWRWRARAVLWCITRTRMPSPGSLVHQKVVEAAGPLEAAALALCIGYGATE